MDIINFFLEKQINSKKIKVSTFFENNESLITKMLYETIPTMNAKELKKFWVDIFNNFQKNFIFDFNLVDWSRISKIINYNLLNNQADQTLDTLLSQRLNSRLDEIDTFFNSQRQDIPFNQDTTTLKKKFNRKKKELVRAQDIHHQDYVYYGILDFVTKTDGNTTKSLLNDDYEKWKTNLIDRVTNSDDIPSFIHDFTKNILQSSTEKKAKENEKKAKKQLLKDDEDYKLKKRCLELMKIQRKRLKEDLVGENEYSFIISYFSKILTTVFDTQKNVWQYKWGELKLAASKEEENLAKNDDQNRVAGSSIDCVVALKELKLNILLVEVSGPMNKEDYIHFLKDRLKIAKNLKYMYKSITRQKLVLSDAPGLELYGLQVYRNYIYVYALQMPILNFFCFVEVLKFKIPTNPATSLKDTPRFFKNLFKVLDLVKFSQLKWKSYMTRHDDFDSDDSLLDENNSLSPPYILPQKITKKRKNVASTNISDKRQKQQ